MLQSTAGYGLKQDEHKLVTLDGLRGVAALAVMVFHLPMINGPLLVPHGFLAVDFFFMLSGFVLSYAYQQRLDGGWATLAFVKARLIRLYPLYALGLGLGFVYLLVQQSHGAGAMPRSSVLPLLLLGVFMLPAIGVPQAGMPRIFPLNAPSWSLFYELVINIVHALFLRRRSMGFLLGLIAVSGVGSAAYSIHAQTTDYGVGPHDIAGALLRITFAYTVGMVTFRMWDRGRRVKALPSWLLIVILIAALATPTFGHATVYLELLLIVGVFPLLLASAASARPAPGTTRLYRELGTLSYALYLLQVPIFTVFDRVLNSPRITHHPPPMAVTMTLCCAATIAAAVLADRYYDLPVRAFLKRRLA